MGETTAISWTDHTFNPWWGCWKIADECANCYADSLANHYAPGHWGRTAPRRFFGDKHWNEPRKWDRKAREDGVRRRVFVGSMCDWAEIHPDPAIQRQLDAYRGRLFELILECDALDWLLLTKRIDDVADHALLPWLVPVRDRKPRPLCRDCADSDGLCMHRRGEPCDPLEPWPHVWLGYTAGTRKMLRGVNTLRTIPAARRFISCEPLLEHIPREEWDLALVRHFDRDVVGDVDWLIVGDESASDAKRRPAQADWVRTAREAALVHGVAFHFKQWNGPTGGGVDGERIARSKKIHLPILDGKRWAEFPR